MATAVSWHCGGRLPAFRERRVSWRLCRRGAARGHAGHGWLRVRACARMVWESFAASLGCGLTALLNDFVTMPLAPQRTSAVLDGLFKRVQCEIGA